MGVTMDNNLGTTEMKEFPHMTSSKNVKIKSVDDIKKHIDDINVIHMHVETGVAYSKACVIKDLFNHLKKSFGDKYLVIASPCQITAAQF